MVGKRGPLSKPADRAQGHRAKELTLVQGGNLPVKVPRPPKGLAPEVRRAWAAYWRLLTIRCDCSAFNSSSFRRPEPGCDHAAQTSAPPAASESLTVFNARW